MAHSTNGHSEKNELPSGVHFEEIEIPVPWGIVSGKWWGPRNKQPVLAIHGWQDNAGTWDKLIPLLPVDLSVLCIDLPGHGKSSHYTHGMQYYIFWDGINLIRRIVKYYAWEKITLLGHSLGGALSFMYAACFPDDIDGYISIDIASPTVRDPARVAKMSGGAIDKFLSYENLKKEQAPCYEYDTMISVVHDAHEGSITKESAEILMRRGMAPAPSSDSSKKLYYFTRDVRLKVALLGMMSIEQVLEYAKKIKCRVLYIRAVPGMKWDRPEYFSSVIDKVKETAEILEYEEVEGTHHVHLNNPERISVFVAEFLGY